MLGLPFLEKHDPEYNLKKRRLRWRIQACQHRRKTKRQRGYGLLSYPEHINSIQTKIFPTLAALNIRCPILLGALTQIITPPSMPNFSNNNEDKTEDAEDETEETEDELNKKSSSSKIIDPLPTELQDFWELFNRKDKPLPEHSQWDHAINIEPGKKPPFVSLYNLSSTELQFQKQYLQDHLREGLIRHSQSSAGASMLFRPKKDGGLRPCIDYRGLNNITIKDRCPLPLITESLDQLGGARWFTKLDIKDAFNRLRIKMGDEWKTAFRTRFGLFEY